MMSENLILDRVALFQGIDPDWRYYLTERLQRCEYKDDESIFRAGDVSQSMYLVESGEVVLFTDTLGEPVQLRARVEAGGLFGEIGVLEASTRTLSARADGPCVLYRLDGNDLIAIARAHDSLAQELCRVAIGYSLENRAAQAELARRKEVRIRIGAPVELRGEFDRRPLILENLSLGGACFADAPPGWALDEKDMLSVGIDPTTSLFNFHGRIAWQRGNRAGCFFTHTFSNHELKIAQALHRLITQAKEAAVAG